MRKFFWRRLLPALVGVVALSLSASAAITVQGTAGAGWQSWSAPNKDGNPYWDNVSLDGGNRNVGYFLSGTGAYTGHPDSPNITPVWWGFGAPASGPATADLNFYFQSTLPLTVRLVIEVSARANVNEIGWYQYNSVTDTISPGGVLFPGPAGAGATVVFSPSTNFGLYLKTTDGVYYTQSKFNPVVEQDHQHFALFKESPGVYWIGVEDKRKNTGEGFGGDYNDVIIRMAVVPEPATVGLFALGLLPLLRRRKA